MRKGCHESRRGGRGGLGDFALVIVLFGFGISFVGVGVNCIHVNNGGRYDGNG